MSNFVTVAPASTPKVPSLTRGEKIYRNLPRLWMRAVGQKDRCPEYIYFGSRIASGKVKNRDSSDGDPKPVPQKHKEFCEQLVEFFTIGEGGTFVVQPGATVKNFDTLWRFRTDGQTAQSNAGWQVGRPSKFFHSNFVCLIQSYDKRKATTKVNAYALKRKIQTVNKRLWANEIASSPLRGSSQ